jgi:N-acetylglutamate synthase-like GNAT family acetyltransferase
MQIRPARSADAEAINELLDQLGYPQDGQATMAARIQTWVDDRAGPAYVADAQGDLHGVIAVHICPFFERDGAWGRIVALVVSDRARGQGIGARAIEMFLPIASGIIRSVGGRRSTDLGRDIPSVLVTAASLDRA